MTVGETLRRAIAAHFSAFAVCLEIEELSRRDWASITFSGERLCLRLRLDGPDAMAATEAFLDRLDEREFNLRGHFVADIAAHIETRLGESLRLLLEILIVAAD